MPDSDGRAHAADTRSRLIEAAWVCGFLAVLVGLYWWGYGGPLEAKPEHHRTETRCQYAEQPKAKTKGSPSTPGVVVCFKDDTAGNADKADPGDQEPPKEAVPLSRFVARRVISDPVALFTVVLALFTWRLIVVGRRQHEAAMGALKLANDEFVSTHRPKLIVRHAMAPWATTEDGKPIYVHFSISNTGDTRAKVVRSSLYCEWFEVVLPIVVPTVVDGKNDLGSTVGFESGETKWFIHTTNLTWDFLNMSTKVAVSDAQDSMLQYTGGGPGLYFVGRIVYRDERGVERNTLIRRRYNFSQQRFVAGGDPELDYAD